MRSRIGVAAAGVGVVAGYAAIMALQALVWDPLAAVPGRSLDQIRRRVAALGMDVGTDVSVVVALAAAGVLLGVGVGVLCVMGRLPIVATVTLFLGVLAGGGIATFMAGFQLEMDVADAYGIGGEDRTIWAGLLYVTSLLSVLGMLLVPAVLAARRWRRQQPSRAAS